MYQKMDNNGQNVELKVNDNKTEFLQLGWRKEQEEFLEIDGMWSSFINDKSIGMVIKERIAVRIKPSYSLKEMLSSKSVSMNTKVRLFNTVMCPAIIYN